MSKKQRVTPKKNIVRRQARRREPLPDEQVRIRQPKHYPNPPSRPNMLMMLPMVIMALSVGGISFFASRGADGATRTFVTAIPMVLMAVSMIGVQRLYYRSQLKTHQEDITRIDRQYQEHLSQTEERLQHFAQEQRRILHQENPSLQELVRRLQLRATTLWERQPFDNDFLAVRLGLGRLPISVAIKAPERDDEDPRLDQVHELVEKYRMVDNLPITANLNRLGAIGIQGRKRSEALYMAFVMVANIVVHHSPDEVNLYVFSHRQDAAERWGWLRWLPHSNAIEGGSDGPSRISLHPGSDEPVLLELSQILRNRADRQRNSAMGIGTHGQSEPHIVIIFDSVPLLQGHNVMNMLLAHHPDDDVNKLRASAVFVDAPIPPQIKAMVTLNDGHLEYRETWSADANQIQQWGAFESCTPRQMEQIARSMAPLFTEERFGSGRGLPSSVRLVELLNVDQPTEINFEQLYREKYEPRMVMSFPVGLDIDLKPLNVILREAGLGGYGSHAMLAGMTGTGKSVLLQAMVLSMALHHSPRHLNFVLADFKGEGELGKIQELPHVVGFVTDLLKPSAVERFRIALESELDKRNQLFASSQYPVTNIRRYNELYPNDPLPHLVVLLDEFARGLVVNPLLRATIDRIAAQGRSLGIHLILSTQRATDFDGKIRPNIDVRMSLRVASKEDSKAMFNRDEAFTKLTKPGQAYLQVGDNEVFEMFQAARADTPYLPEGTVSEAQAEQIDDFTIFRFGPDGRRQSLYRHEAKKTPRKEDAGVGISEAEKLVSLVQEYCAERYPAARIICLPPLPHPDQLPLARLLSNDSLFRAWIDGVKDWQEESRVEQRLKLPVGMLDLPARQEQRPYTIDLTLRDGNFLVIGPAGSGKGLFLRTLVLGLALSHSPDDLHFYFLSRGPALSVYEDLPHCGAVIRSLETERINRLLDFLEEMIAERHSLMREARVDDLAALRRQRPDLLLPALVVVIEDFAGFRADHGDKLETIQKLTGDAQEADIHFVISANALNAVQIRIQDNLRNRLALGLKDRAAYIEVLGERVEVVDEVAGRGYAQAEQEVLACQIASPIVTVDRDGDCQIASVREVVESMDQFWKGKRAVPIRELQRHLMLDEIWNGDHTVGSDGQTRVSAPVGLEYEALKPVIIDYDRFGPYSLVVGPSGSGKSYFLATLCLATASSLPPDDMQMVIVAPNENPLWWMRGLAHLRLAQTATQIEETLTELTEHFRQSDAAESAQTMLVIDDLQTVLRRCGNFATLLDRCVQAGQDHGIHVIFSETSTALNFEKGQNFGFQTLQLACKYGSGVTFGIDQTDQTLLNLALPISVQNLHRGSMGRGRAMLAGQNRAKAVQFATLASPQGDSLKHKENVRELVAQINRRYQPE